MMPTLHSIVDVHVAPGLASAVGHLHPSIVGFFTLCSAACIHPLKTHDPTCTHACAPLQRVAMVTCIRTVLLVGLVLKQSDSCLRVAHTSI
jgi:hypothetical protein